MAPDVHLYPHCKPQDGDLQFPGTPLGLGN
jgi:hypothetical protein